MYIYIINYRTRHHTSLNLNFTVGICAHVQQFQTDGLTLGADIAGGHKHRSRIHGNVVYVGSVVDHDLHAPLVSLRRVHAVEQNTWLGCGYG